MSLMLRGVQMKTPLAMRTVTRDRPLILLFVPPFYSMTAGILFPIRWKRTRFLSLTESGWDATTSPYSPVLLHATLQGIGIAI